MMSEHRAELAPVAQRIRASASGAEGRWFKSSRAYQAEGCSGVKHIVWFPVLQLPFGLVQVQFVLQVQP